MEEASVGSQAVSIDVLKVKKRITLRCSEQRVWKVNPTEGSEEQTHFPEPLGLFLFFFQDWTFGLNVLGLLSESLPLPLGCL